MESKRKVWNGDVDHDNSKLQELTEEYLDMNAKMGLYLSQKWNKYQKYFISFTC